MTREPVLPIRCNPGEAPCRAYLQLSSYSFSAATRERRHEQLKERLQRHAHAMPQSVVVFEDFDHMDCDLRRLICDVRPCLTLAQLALPVSVHLGGLSKSASTRCVPEASPWTESAGTYR